MSCMRQTRLTQVRHMVVLLAGPISHTSIQYIDFVDIFNVLSGFDLLLLLGFKLLLCIVVTLVQNATKLLSGVKLSIRWFCLIFIWHKRPY